MYFIHFQVYREKKAETKLAIFNMDFIKQLKLKLYIGYELLQTTEKKKTL